MKTHTSDPDTDHKLTGRKHGQTPFRFRYRPRLEWLEDRTVPTTLPGSLFEIDGNLIIDAAGNKDWANAPGLLIKTDLPTGQSDDSLGQGAKEDTPVPSVVTGSIPNNKSDLTQFYFAQEFTNGKLFVYLAWERANTLGSANIDFEFNQSEATSANGVTPIRTPGDLLISFDFSNGGDTITLSLRKWLDTGKWGPATNLGVSAIGAVNNTAFGQGAVVDPLTNQTLPVGTFGEAAIDLIAAGVFPQGQLVHFGRAYVKSRSSDSFTSELKDFIAPLEIDIDIGSSTGDRVWHDLDGDGVQDAGEPGIGGVTLTMTGTTVYGAPVSRSTTTDATGYYLFDDVYAGTYSVAVAAGNFAAGGPLAGCDATAALQGGDVARDSNGSPTTVALDFMEHDLTNDFGYFKTSSIGDRVWHDLDGDGVQDAGEPGIAGVAVTLTGTTGTRAAVSKSTTTDASGLYQFTGLAPGSYDVAFAKPAGYVFTTRDLGSDDAVDSDADATGATTAVVLTSGGSDLTRDAGLYLSASLGDYVWEDADGDGVQDAGEAGIAGVTVTLTGTTGAGASVSKSMTTVAGGSYQFTGLAPGSYQVSFAAPSGYVFTAQDMGGDDGKDSDAGVTGGTAAVTLASGQSNPTRDAGLYRQASIGDYVWEDADGDGVQDAGEAGIAGVTVTLTGTTGAGASVSKSTTTNASGLYLFGGLAPGSYQVGFAAPGGYVFTARDQGTDDGKDSDADAAGATSAVVLASGQSNPTRDAGLYRQASIGDYVWEDADGDGVQDAGEAGIAGVTVTLTGTTGAGASVSKSMTTVAGGSYQFTGLAPGSYQVSFAAPSGYVFTVRDQGTDDGKDSDADGSGGTTPVVLTSGQSDLTRDAGLYKPAVVGDFAWLDMDGDGVQDAGEPGLGNVTVTLTGTTGTGASVSTSMTTGGDGAYKFGGLAPGSYAVSFTAPGGYVFTAKDQGDDGKDSDADAAGGTSSVVLISGQSDLTRDAGLYRLGSIGDFVWVDSNANGIQDAGEPGLGGVVVTLSGKTGAGVDVVSTATTNSLGYYHFGDLAPGSYKVNFTADGYVFTAKDQGLDDGKDSDADADGNTGAVTLVSGQSITTRDAGVYRLGSIGDYVWEDANGNGVQDAGEPGIGGVVVTLSRAGVDLATTTTGTGGAYLFEALVPGTYAVRFTKPAGYEFTAAGQGGDAGKDSDADAAGGTTAVNLAGGQSDLTRDAGLYRPVSIGDRVWEDANGNGVQDVGEPGIAGVTVTLTGTTGANAAVSMKTTTGTGGLYQFGGLAPGSYAVSFTAPGGYVFTLKEQGPAGKDSDADAAGGTSSVVLTSGEINMTRDAGLYRPVSIGDRVWEDANGNGVQDVGEPGIAGVTVTLRGAGGAALATTTTGTGGAYLFGGLVPGSYAVSFAAPGGYVFTARDQGGDDGKDSDANDTGATDAVTLASGQSDLTRDAGLYRPAAVGNFAWLDASEQGTIANSNGILSGPGVGTNVNGIQDAGEDGIQWVKVTLTGWTGAGAPVNLTAWTDATGYYQFTGLAPGNYMATFTPLVGQVITVRDQGTNDAMDSDADPSTGATAVFALASGQTDTTLDAGVKPIDLSLTKVVDPNLEHYSVGDLITYVIVVSNAEGYSTATNVQVTDQLPDGLELDSWLATQGTYDPNTGIWYVGQLAGGDDATLRIYATPEALPVISGEAGSGTLAGSLFEIDGNMGVDVRDADGNPLQFDWENAPGLLTKADAPPGQGDDALGRGAKEDTPVPSVVTGSIPKNKSDLTNFYFAQEVSSGKVFLYLAWERANTLGTANIDFEFNQSDVISANGVSPVRTPGDLLISFDFSGGGKTVVLGIREWLATGKWGPASTLDPNVAVGAVNDLLTFGEAAINLTDTGLFPADECVHFGRAYVKSRSSDSFTSELKDFIAPMAVDVETCAMVTNRAEVTFADQRDDDSTPGNGWLLVDEDDAASAGVTVMLSTGATIAPSLAPAAVGPTLPAAPQGGAESAESDTAGHDAGALSGHGRAAKSAPDTGAAFTVLGVAPPWGSDNSSASAGGPAATPLTPTEADSLHEEEPGDVQPTSRDDRPAVSVWERTVTKGARRWQPVIAFAATNDDWLAMGVFGPYVGS